MAAKVDDTWQVREDLRTLCEAEKIKKDAKRFKRCQELAKQQMLEMAGVASEEAE